jgi:hypothetical protein
VRRLARRRSIGGIARTAGACIPQIECSPCAHANQESRVSAPGAHAANDPIEKLTPVLSIGVHTNARHIAFFSVRKKRQKRHYSASYFIDWLLAESQ